MLDNVDFITKYFLHQQHLSGCGELGGGNFQLQVTCLQSYDIPRYAFKQTFYRLVYVKIYLIVHY